jgi:hypothetical protein
MPVFPRTLTLLLVLAMAGLWMAQPAAHDLPTSVVVQIFARPEGGRLRLLVRVPLEAMGDVDYPTRGPGDVLDLSRIDPALVDAAQLWLVPGFEVYEDQALVGPPRVTSVRLSLPSDRSFVRYDDALAHVTGPALPPDTTVRWQQGMLDAVLDYDIQSDESALAIRPLVARLGVRVVTALRVARPGGTVRAFEFTGDPGLVRLDPRWHEAAWQFVTLGFRHILSGADHLLFLVCLVIPLRRLRALVPVVTAFAVAHSITLIASAFGAAPGVLWFPPLIETLIAASIVYMALENMLASRFDHRWVVAFGFGLVHGFGFSFALQSSLQFAGSHLVASLLAFNVGVEIGQLLVLGLLIPPLALVMRLARSERVAIVVLSAIVAHSAWHWMTQRGAELAEFQFAWPRLDAAFAASLTGWLLLLVVAGGVFWLLRLVMGWVDRRFLTSPR